MGRRRNQSLLARQRVVLAALLMAVATVAAAQPRSSEQGGVIAKRLCRACHAVGRDGSSPNPAALPLRELHRRYDPEVLAEALAEGIHVGNPAMPAFRFGEADVAAIILYLKRIQDEPTPGA